MGRTTFSLSVGAFAISVVDVVEEESPSPSPAPLPVVEERCVTYGVAVAEVTDDDVDGRTKPEVHQRNNSSNNRRSHAG